MTTKKTALVAIGVIVAGLAGLAFVYRADLQLRLMVMMITPNQAFTDASSPAPPDYANPLHWAALPDRADLADSVPTGATDAQATASVDLFFLHPTTFLSPDAWNQSLDDAATNELTDEMVMRGQASVFNGCCRIYAPRYRQATLAAFFDEGESASRALALAYVDVVAAFRYYMTHFNEGRPFVLAAHSQGSRHADYLMADEIVGTELAGRMIAAYPVGFELDGSNGVPVCETPTQTGCQVTWNSVGPAAGALFASPDNICVNPLTWRIDGALADRAANLGAVNLDAGDAPEPGVADAQCRDGRLYVSEIHSDNYSLMPLGRDNYHIYDYALFYMNIRENVQARVDAFLALHGDDPAPHQDR